MISNSALREAKKIDSQTAPRKELTDPEFVFYVNFE
jgi:hypothetical protein